MEIVNSSGYKLTEFSNNSWQVVGPDSAYSGNFKGTVKYAVTVLGFRLEEIEYAIERMIELNHNTAHFGIYKNLIYTYNTEIKEIA